MMKIPTGFIDKAIVNEAKGYFNSAFAGQISNTTSYTSSKSNRQTIEYGYSFRLARDAAEFGLANKIPRLLIQLYSCALETLSEGGCGDLPSSFDTCLVNLYREGVDLFPHVDMDRDKASKESRPFYFGPQVIGITMISDIDGAGLYIQKFRPDQVPTHDASKAIELNEKDGSCYLLTDDYRHAPWHHGVKTIKKLRMSATFRTLYQINEGNIEDARIKLPRNHYEI